LAELISRGQSIVVVLGHQLDGWKREPLRSAAIAAADRFAAFGRPLVRVSESFD
jgi:hypothetical protein